MRPGGLQRALVESHAGGRHRPAQRPAHEAREAAARHHVAPRVEPREADVRLQRIQHVGMQRVQALFGVLADLRMALGVFLQRHAQDVGHVDLEVREVAVGALAVDHEGAPVRALQQADVLVGHVEGFALAERWLECVVPLREAGVQEEGRGHVGEALDRRRGGAVERFAELLERQVGRHDAGGAGFAVDPFGLAAAEPVDVFLRDLHAADGGGRQGGLRRRGGGSGGRAFLLAARDGEQGGCRARGRQGQRASPMNPSHVFSPMEKRLGPRGCHAGLTGV